MNILITGSTGFLGQHLCKRLEQDGHELTKLNSKNCDLTDASSLSSLPDTTYDLVYHLAAWTQAGDFCLTHQGEQWIINQQINTNVLAWWHDRQPQAKVVAIGSSCCYPEDLPLKEEHLLHGTPTESLLTYGMTKRMLYVGLEALHAQFGHNYLFLIPSTLYGADYHLDGRQMHFIFDLVRKIVEARHGGPDVELWGDGRQSRELIHVRDFVNAAVHLSGTVENEVVNIGSGREFPIRWYAETISRMIDFDPSLIKYRTDKYVGVRSKVLDVDKLRTLMPGFEPTDLEDGLREVIDWYVQAKAL